MFQAPEKNGSPVSVVDSENDERRLIDVSGGGWDGEKN